MRALATEGRLFFGLALFSLCLLIPATGSALAQSCSQSPPTVCNGTCPAGLVCTPDALGGPCRCEPGGFPPGGTDLSPTEGLVLVDVFGVGPVNLHVSGETLLEFSDPQTDPGTGGRFVETEILSMDLSGASPQIGSVNVRAGSSFGLPPTNGSVTPLAPTSDFPARATFDVFFEVEVIGVATLRNNQPLVMEADINEIPPRSIALRNQAPVTLVDTQDPTHIDTILTSAHWMCPPPFPPPGTPCPVPCDQSPFPVCEFGDCPPTEICVGDSAQATCVCAPAFPPAGTDLSPSTGVLEVELPGIGPVETSAAGDLLLQWSDPQVDPGTGQRTVQTEMLAMDLSGFHPRIGSLNVQAGSQFGLTPSLGTVVPLGTGGDFPARATFDVFFDVEVLGLANLRNDEPLVMEADINEIPPRNIGLRSASAVLLQDVVDPTQVNILRRALHWMCPPPFPPPGIPCPVPCDRNPYPTCSPGQCPAPQQCAPDDATGICACRDGFPPGGTDLSPTVGVFRVDVIGVGPVDTQVSGDTLLQFGNPQTDPGTGVRTVQTEILAMDLSGSTPDIGTLNVRAGSQFGLPPTNGTVVPIGAADFPARASFDVFFEVDVLGVATLRNDQPLVMEADIDEIPPRNLGLRNQAPVVLTDILDPQHVDTLETATHWMCPPPFPPPGIPCPVPCDQVPYPVCLGQCGTGEVCAPVPARRASSLGPFGDCRCVPDSFPPAGTDLSPSTGIFDVDISGIGPVEASVSGDLLLEWQDPVTDPGTGQRSVETEMLSMDLSGFNPSIGNVTVRGGALQGLPQSSGSVTPLESDSDFPALASFDVFFEVEVLGVTTLTNNQPLVMEAVIEEIPPRNLTLENQGAVQLQDTNVPPQNGTLQTAGHWMCPPPFPPPGVPCPVPCDQSPYPACSPGQCPPDLPHCVPDDSTQRCACAGSFPPGGGLDLSPTSGLVQVDVIGVGPVDVIVTGETLLQFGAPQTGPTGQRSVQTEMVSLSLSGTSPLIGDLHVRAGADFGLPPTLGSVTPVGSADFPATASFDVFFEVEVVGQAVLRNNDPLQMQAQVIALPPRNLGLQNQAPVQIIDIADPLHIDTIQTAFHWMCPPPFPPPGVPCPVPCNATPVAVCDLGACPPGLICVDDGTSSCSCITPPPTTSGEISAQLTMAKPSPGNIRLDWGASCLASDTDYGIYEGTIGTFGTYGRLVCTTGGATTITIPEPAASTFYFVVPHDGGGEGSYGKDSGSVPRGQGAPACFPQQLGVCP